ncbi:MAG TPA: DoxX family protein [Terriglobia bacterium]|jgi:putative oxidoreductase|nr:DoxX family protein [Terriglobia bacterium]
MVGSRFSEHVYGLTRFVFGGLFACHGAQKLFGVLGGHQMTGNPKMLAAGIIEFFGGSLIALGIAASLAAFIACGEMAYAFFTVHYPRGFWPIMNGGEPAVLYCFFFLYVALRGSGRYSIEGLVRRN